MSDLSQLSDAQLVQLIQQAHAAPAQSVSAPQKPQSHDAPFTWEGLGKSIATGAAQFGTGTLGLGMDLLNTIEGDPRDTYNAVRQMQGKPAVNFPSNTQQLDNIVSAPTGGYHQPQNIYENYGQTFGQMAPAFLGGEATIPAKIAKMLAVPAATETAGQIAKETGYEAPARIAAALVSSVATPSSFGSIARTEVPSIAELKSQASDAYDTVDKSGMLIAQPSLKAMADTTKQQLADLGIDPTLQPNAMASLNRLQSAAENNHTLKGMDILRRVAQNSTKIASKAGNDSDAMMSNIIKNNIDNYVSGLGPQDVIGKVDQNALDALDNARNLWSRAAKSQNLEDLINKAELKSTMSQATSSGQAIRGKFGNLAQNQNAMAGFSPDEQAAILKVARGTYPERVARVIGKLSPDHALPLMAGLMEGGNALFEGDLPKVAATVGVLGAGTLGKIASNAITAKNARLAAELIRAGGSSTAQSLPATTTSLTSPALAAYLSQIGRQPQPGTQ